MKQPDWSLTYQDPGEACMAAEEWTLIYNSVKELNAGNGGYRRLVAGQANMINRLVHARMQFNKSAYQLEENGQVQKVSEGKVPNISAELTAFKNLSQMCSKLEDDLGLKPNRIERRTGRPTKEAQAAKGKTKPETKAKPAAATKFLQRAG